MKVLLLANNIGGLISFRLEVVKAIIKQGYSITISAPFDERMDKLKALGAKCVISEINRRSTNPIQDLMLLCHYLGLIKNEKPDVILSYTIKPNVYGGIACRLWGIPQVANITGLGTAVENPSKIQKVVFLLYKVGLKNAKRIFFQNEENKKFCEQHKLTPNCGYLIPGSGVNLTRFRLMDYLNNEVIRFIFISRIMKQKGIDQYLDAAVAIRKEYPDTEFHILGYCEDAYEEKLRQLHDWGIVIYHGATPDVRPFIANVHCVIHPTYYPEGMSNVLLESCAIGRPIITTNRSGCREIVDDGINGFIVEQQNSEDLITKVRQFLSLSFDEKRNMGLAARKKVEKQFDRNIIVKAYLEAIECFGKQT